MGLFTMSKPEPVQVTSEPQPSSKRLCLQRLDEVMAQPKTKGATMKLYLEGFKSLNDTFGYAFGEQLLEEITKYLSKLTDGQLYRYIGVEFVAILNRVSYSKAAEMAEQIIERFSHTWNIGGTDCLCSIHVGMAIFPGRADNATHMMTMLDQAISESVSIGQGTYVVYDDILHGKYCRRQNIAHALGESIQNDLFEFYYRPTFCLSENRYTRAECSVRLFVAGEGLVYASEFIPIAEDSGQIVSYQYYALEKACECIRVLMDAGKYFESIAVPASVVFFFQKDMIDRVQELLQKYNIPPQKLAFEIAESVLTTAYLNANIAMQELSDIGIELILNDFGTGYSGISNILDIPVDVLKLERMFIWQLEISERSGYLIEGLVHIANRLGIKLISEGVETDHQHELLLSYGCNYEQGYYHSNSLVQDQLCELFQDI